MTEISKNEAIVLRKTNFSDSSLIVHFYTREHGRISALLKGARSSKSKIGSKVDLINHVEIIFYRKEHKELQLVTQANLLNHFPNIKSDLEKLKYASAACELILKLVPENEANDKLFRGLIKILKLIDKNNNDSILLFSQFFIFFTKEIGFEINFNSCSSCGKELDNQNEIAFSYEDGIICKSCDKDKLIIFNFSAELFNLFKCLTTKINNMSYNKSQLENIIFILEKFLIYHNSEFSGIKSLKMF